MGSNSTSPPTSTSTSPTIYFGYGSNLWLHQMALRCPTSTYLGVARLNGWKWIINERGYANVVELPSTTTTTTSLSPPAPISNNNENYSTLVYGLVYSLQPTDETRLDKNEGVPDSYTKEMLDIDFWPGEVDGKVDVTKPPEEKRSMLVYVDRKRVGESKPKKEYVVRMNCGIRDALDRGVPEGYVEGVMRAFIPEEKGKGEGIGELAMRQAGGFVSEDEDEDESGD